MAATGGNDATIAAGGSEATAPVLSQALYGTQDPSKLTDEQKNTLTTIADLAGTVVGATTGEGTNAVASGQAAQNAVANNFLGDRSLDALKTARRSLTSDNAETVIRLDKANQLSDQLLDRYKKDPDSLSPTEKENLQHYVVTYYNEQKAKYGAKVANQLTQLLFKDSPKVSDSALGYNFPYALDTKSKDLALDKIKERNNANTFDYLTGIREVGENEKTYHKAEGVLRINGVIKAQGEFADTILMAAGIGELSTAVKSGVPLLKKLFKSTDNTASFSKVHPTGSNEVSRVESTVQGTGTTKAETVVSSGSKDAVGNTGTAQVESVVTNSGAAKRLAAYKKHSGNWASGSLNGTLDKYVKGVKGQLSPDGVKTNFINEKAGIKIMKDNENNYFRIYDMNRKTYLDTSGSVVKTGSLKGKDAKNFLQEQTHIKNID